MTTDQAHTILGLVALSCIAGGSWLAFGAGYSLLLTGTVLLVGICYARTR